MAHEDDSAGVLDDCDFLLQLAEEVAVDKGLAPRPATALAPAPLRSTGLDLGFRPPTSAPVAPKPITDSGFYIEPQSGLKVSRPVLGSVIVRERLRDRTFVKIAAAKQLLHEGGTDWATVAVVVNKTQQEARNGGHYSRWQLSDLDGATVTLFLFGNAHKELYKEELGSVILLHNAKVSADKGGGGGVTLTIEQPEHVTRIGQSTDFGYCKGTKGDGNPCRAVVCRSKCDYCPYHAAQALRKLQSQRPDIRGRSILTQQLRPEAAKVPSWQTLPSDSKGTHPARPHAPQLSGKQLGDAALKLMAARKAGHGTGAPANGLTQRQPLQEPGATQLPMHRNRGLEAVMGVARAEQGTPAPQPGAAKPTVTAQQRPSVAATSAPQTAPAALLPADDVELFDSEEEDAENQAPGDSTAQGTAGGGGGMSAAKARLLAAVAKQKVQQQTDPLPHSDGSGGDRQTARTLPGVPRSDAGQRGALGDISHRVANTAPQGHATGPLRAAAVNANATAGVRVGAATATQAQAKGGSVTGKRPAPGADKTGKGFLASVMRPQAPQPVRPAQHQVARASGSGGGGDAPPARSAMAAAFGAVAARVQQEEQERQTQSQDGGMQSRYHELGEEAAWEEIQHTLDTLEKKDALVQQLDSVKVLKVSAFHCSHCDVFTEFKRKECADAGHSVQRVNTTKRFWVCCHCNARSTSLGVIYPKRRCPRCNDPHMEYKPTTMYSGARGGKPAAEGTGLAERSNLLARGTEHTFALGGN